MLQEGMQAPAFTLADKDGKMVSLSDFLGKKVVLYFYPLRTKNLRKSIICPSFCCPIPNCRQFRHTVYGKRKNCTERQAWASFARRSLLTNKEKL